MQCYKCVDCSFKVSLRKIRFNLCKSPQLEKAGLDDSADVLIKFKQRVNHHTQIPYKRTAVGVLGTNHTVMSMQGITFSEHQNLSFIFI